MELSILTFTLWVGLLKSIICSNINTRATCVLSETNVWTCDNLPLDIPNGVTSVHIKNFLTELKEFQINGTSFQNDNWKTIKYLQFSDDHDYKGERSFRLKDGALRNLQNLEVLHIHLENSIYFEPDSLAGVQKVKILDFNGCFRLRLKDVTVALNGTDKVPYLEQLLLSGINYLREPLRIDETFSSTLKLKPLTRVDLSRTRISVMELSIIKGLKQLKTFNISYAMVNELSHRGVLPKDLRHIQTMDISYTSIDSLQLRYDFHNFTSSLSNVNYKFKNRGNHVGLFLSASSINISGILKYPVFIYHTKIWSTIAFKSYSKNLIAMGNKLRRIDVEFVCENFDLTSIEMFNFAKNKLEYFHPSVFACMFNIRQLDISGNNLHLMYIENKVLFIQLLKPLKQLKEINLASNSFIDIPDEFFKGNNAIEVINLEDNRLTQVHFKMDNLRKLRVLNLSKNRITILDDATMNNLDFISLHEDDVIDSDNATFSRKLDNIYKLKVSMQSNPFACDKCEALDSVRWILKTDLFRASDDNMTCTGESGEQLLVTGDTIKAVEGICNRKTRKIILTTTVTVLSGLVCTLSFILYLKQRQRKKQARKNNVIDLIRGNERRFFVFLSYSGRDEDFVMNYIFDPLNEGLQGRVGIDRTLVCVGDMEFRPGQNVHDEALRCIEHSAVFVSVVSNSYCNSNHCDQEFNLAVQSNTPVLLMIKDNVDVTMMTPTMLLLFRNKVRILWENNNGVYRLKTSWDNVCEAILNIAAR